MTEDAPHKPVTIPGDVWLLGKHRLACIDTTKTDVYSILFPEGHKADLLFTSPPYGSQRNYKVGDIPWTDLMKGMIRQFNLVAAEKTQVLINLGLVHRDHEWQPYWEEWLEWIRTEDANTWRRFGWYIWDQGSGLPGDWNGRFAPRFEFIFHFNHKEIRPNKIIKCIAAGKLTPENKRGGLRDKSGGDSTHWTHAGAAIQEWRIPDSIVHVQREATSGIQREHPAVFPIKLPEFIIRSYSQEGQIVYEPFSGSGTTILAAENTNRICYASEISPEYVDIAIRRYRKMFPGAAEPILDSTGDTFQQTAKERGIELPKDNRFRDTTGTMKLDYVEGTTLEELM